MHKLLRESLPSTKVKWEGITLRVRPATIYGDSDPSKIEASVSFGMGEHSFFIFFIVPDGNIKKNPYLEPRETHIGYREFLSYLKDQAGEEFGYEDGILYAESSSVLSLVVEASDMDAKFDKYLDKAHPNLFS